MYKVIKKFIDLQDNKHLYRVGDEFPRLGYKPSLSRIKELSSNNNLQKAKLIKEIEDLENDKNDEVDETIDLLENEEDKEIKKEKKTRKKKK